MIETPKTEIISVHLQLLHSVLLASDMLSPLISLFRICICALLLKKYLRSVAFPFNLR